MRILAPPHRTALAWIRHRSSDLCSVAVRRFVRDTEQQCSLGEVPRDGQVYIKLARLDSEPYSVLDQDPFHRAECGSPLDLHGKGLSAGERPCPAR